MIPRVLIDVTGGVVQWINADGPVDVIIMDDASEVDCESELKQVRKVGNYNWFFWGVSVEIVNPIVIDPFFKAAKEIENELRPQTPSI